MWKESYRIGVDIVDQQHKELFEMVESLIKIVNGGKENVREESMRAVAFLKDYTVKHFSDEEAYQRSVNYVGYAQHKTVHEDFIQTVLDFERKMTETDFAENTVKQFAGILTTWLIYHVCGEDRKFTAAAETLPLVYTPTYQEGFAESMKNVFVTLTGTQVANVSAGLPQAAEDLRINVGLIGSQEGDATFVFPKETAFEIFKVMTFMEPEGIDDIMISALCEVSNIVSGNAASVLAAGGNACDITTPTYMEEKQPLDVTQSLLFTTELGDVGVSVQLK